MQTSARCASLTVLLILHTLNLDSIFVFFLLQRLSPPSEDFFKKTKLTAFGAEGLFMRNPAIPLSKAFINDANHEIKILDLDWIMTQKLPYKLGTIYGGIESTKGQTNPPKFQPSDTDAASRLIDVYITPTSS